MFCFSDASGETLSGLLRPGSAGANTVADHITVLDRAIAQLPTEIGSGHRAGDGAGSALTCRGVAPKIHRGNRHCDPSDRSLPLNMPTHLADTGVRRVDGMEGVDSDRGYRHRRDQYLEIPGGHPHGRMCRPVRDA
jgi:hypothetical protein